MKNVRFHTDANNIEVYSATNYMLSIMTKDLWKSRHDS